MSDAGGNHAREASGRQAAERLASALNQDDVEAILETENPALLTADQVVHLGRLNEFFQDNVSDHEGRASEEGGGRKRRRGGGSRKGSKRPQEMLRLAKDVHLADVLEKFIQGENATPEAFLSGGPEESTAGFAGDLKAKMAGSAEEAFTCCVTYMHNLESRNIMDATRQCFMWLLFSDLNARLNAEDRTHHTGRRMGHKMKAKVVGALEKFCSDVFTSAEQLRDVKASLDKWTRRGIKIAQLCDEFGEGCLFILAGRLSEDMMDNKYREGEDVPIHVETFEKLHELGLREMGEETGATDLGRRIRDFLSSGWPLVDMV